MDSKRSTNVIDRNAHRLGFQLCLYNILGPVRCYMIDITTTLGISNWIEWILWLTLSGESNTIWVFDSLVDGEIIQPYGRL